MKRKIFSVLLALVLVLSLSLVMAVPAAGSPGTLNVIPMILGGGGGTTEWSTAQSYTGSHSAHMLIVNPKPGCEARIGIKASDVGVSTLADISSISWWEYLVQGYPPHVDVALDIDGNGYLDDWLVFEYAYNSESHYDEAPMPYGAQTGDWYQTFSDDGDGPAQIDDAANAWLASGPPGPPGDENFIYGTLEEWKAGTVSENVSDNTSVMAFVVEVDNWGVQTEAYVDDIAINGVTYYGLIQDAVDYAAGGDIIDVAAGIYDQRVVINKPLTLQGAGTGTRIEPMSEVKLDSLYTLGSQAGALWNGHKLASIISVEYVDLPVTIRDLAVSGGAINVAPAGANYIAGISYGETAGTIENVAVYGMKTSTEQPRTYGIWLDAVDTVSSVEVKNCNVRGYNKNGINARGAKLTVDIHDNTVTGPSPSDIQVPNGILLINGAGGTVGPTNTITSHHYPPVAWTACGICLWDITGIVIEGNDISDCDSGMGLSGESGVSGTTGTIIRENMITGANRGIYLECPDTANNTITHNDIEANDYGIYLAGPDSPTYDPGEEVGPGNEAHFNNITGNTEYGVVNFNPDVTVDATNNWWGNASGPSHSLGYGDPVSDNVRYKPWLLEAVVPGVEPATFDKTLALKDGWTLISTDKEVAASSEWEGVILAYRHKDGYKEVDIDDLEPVEAVYAKTDGGGGVGINYSTGAPGVSSKDLDAGWNLISSATETDAKAVLSPLRHVQVGEEQGICLTTLVSQGEYNQHTGSFYLATLTDDDWGNLPTLNPFDGYWVYMNAAKSFGVIPD